MCRAMDPLFRQRRPSAQGDPDWGRLAADQEYEAALGQGIMGGSSSPGVIAMGESSPGTLEQGTAVVTPTAGAAQPVPTAHPFHSERVQAEVALARSRPTTLDDDAKRMLDVSEAALGDRSLSGRHDEPDYGSGVQPGVPRVARIEYTEGSVTGSKDVGSVTAGDAGTSRGSPEPLSNQEELGSTKDRVREVMSTSADGDDQGVLSFSERPGPEDQRELVPDAAGSPNKIESLLLQVIEENRLLRSRLDQVERSSWHSGATRNTQEAPVASPASFDPRSSLLIGSDPTGVGTVQRLEEFVGNNDPRVLSELQLVAAGGSGWSQPFGRMPPTGHFGHVDQGASRRGPGVPRANSGAIVPPPLPDFRVLDREHGGVPRAQSFRQFRQSIQDSGVSGDNPSGSGFLTPRSGVRGEGEGFDANGYPVSPGGTVIRPPPAHLLSLLVGGIWEQDVAKDSCRQGVLKCGVDQGLPVWALLLQLSLGIWSRGRCLLVWANLMLRWGIQ